MRKDSSRRKASDYGTAFAAQPVLITAFRPERIDNEGLRARLRQMPLDGSFVRRSCDEFPHHALAVLHFHVALLKRAFAERQAEAVIGRAERPSHKVTC